MATLGLGACSRPTPVRVSASASGTTAPAPRLKTVVPVANSSSYDLDSMRSAMARAVAQGVPGIVLYVRGPAGEVSLAAGVSDTVTNAPMRDTHLFRVAANSKMYMAAAAAQLHVDGVIDLDKPAAQHLPKAVVDRLANARQATVRQLLNHTSGIPEYLNDHFLLAALDQPEKQWSDLEALDFAYDIDAEFECGEGWSYSNTNYVLVGMFLDAVTGRHHSDAIRARVFEPLGLEHSFYWDHDKVLGEIAHGYVGAGQDSRDVTNLDMARGLADSGIVASVADMARFIEAVGASGNATLPEAVRTEMFRDLIPTNPGGYGLGVQVFEIGEGEVAIGHGGTMVGYRSEMFYIPGSKLSVAIAANQSQPSEVFDELVVEVLVSLLDPEAVAEK